MYTKIINHKLCNMFLTALSDMSPTTTHLATCVDHPNIHHVLFSEEIIGICSIIDEHTITFQVCGFTWTLLDADNISIMADVCDDIIKNTSNELG